MKLLRATLALCVIVAAGCSSTEKYARNNLAGQKWLDAHADSAAITVTGTWQSDDWGASQLEQSGRRITGNLGRFPVKGVVSGRRAYLLVSEGGWIYYTAVLARSGDTLEGYYSYCVPFEISDQRPLNLSRVRE